MLRGLTVLVRYNASLPYTFHRHILNYVHCFTVYIYQPLFTLLGCNIRLHGVPSAWVFVSGMLAEA